MKNILKANKTVKSTANGMCDIPRRLKLTMSTKYVIGERYDSILPTPPNSESGTKIPLMNINGKRMRLENIIICDGVREDGEANRTPSEEKQKLAKTIPIINAARLQLYPKNKNPASNTMIFITIPNSIPAAISPKIMV